MTTALKSDVHHAAGKPARWSRLVELVKAAASGRATEFDEDQITKSVADLFQDTTGTAHAVQAVLHQIASALERQNGNARAPRVARKTVRATAVSKNPAQTSRATDEEVRLGLENARVRASAPLVTPESIREGAALMETARARAESAFEKDREGGMLIPTAVMTERLDVSRQSLRDAVRAGRMFTIIGPSGRNYYPAFFSNAQTRKDFEKVCLRLGDLPAPTKYHFFFRNTLSLEGKTPLEAMVAGNIDKVLVAADRFRNA